MDVEEDDVGVELLDQRHGLGHAPGRADDVDGVAELRLHLRGRMALLAPGDVRARARQRPDLLAQPPQPFVTRHAQADRVAARKRSAAERRPLPHNDRQRPRPERARQPAGHFVELADLFGLAGRSHEDRHRLRRVSLLDDVDPFDGCGVGGSSAQSEHGVRRQCDDATGE